MTANIPRTTKTRYARTIVASKRARWEIETDIIRGRIFSSEDKFLPDGLSLAREPNLLTDDERVFFSQVQGRTYANIFGLVERFINAKVLEVSKHYFLGDQTALEALVRFSDEELKHQELFRRIEGLVEQSMPDGYSFLPDPNDVARVVLAKSTWSVLALTCLIELFTLAHYKESIEPDQRLSPLFKDVFRFHWVEESQHAILDELEWAAEDERLSPAERDHAVTDLIELVAAVDGILRAQSEADAAYFFENLGREFPTNEQDVIRTTLLRAYRYQYIFSGIQSTRFPDILRERVTEAQFDRITQALSTLA
ncbi:MAG TPA: hypothetical protein VH062_14230 [Polyangiaceae bacterium]|jgi:hypothetical protein|nr:hypothetical protein [Polyangiaceae bacterium]